MLEKCRALVKAWEVLQVELQGQYSPTRLDELHAFTRQTGVVRTIAILLLTPIACVVSTLVLDVTPLRPPIGGIHHQSITYWLRVFLTYLFIAPCSIVQFQHASPTLPLRRGLVIASSIIFAAATPVFYLLAHLLIGFPTPFAIQSVGLPSYAVLCGSIWAMWKNTIRGDPEVQQDLRQYMTCSSCVLTMLTLYPLMIFIFGKLNGIQQTLFSFAFPVLKLLLKIWTSRGLYRLEDLAPVYVVTSIDVFHALLLSCAMQSASSSGTLASVLGVDLFQSVIAFVEVRAIVKRLGRLRLEVSGPEDVRTLGLQAHHHTKNILSVACSSLVSHPHIRDDPAVGLPRHRRLVPWRVVSSLSALVSQKRIIPATSTGPSMNETSVRPPLSGALTTRTAEVEYVQFTLKLLHMVEFYVLIEFVEVVVAAINAIYLTAMFYLPNRAYYPAVRTLTQDQLTETVGQVLHYAAFELLSLAALCVVLDRLLGFSTLRLLAFALRKHAVLVQSQLALWVLMPTQLTLEYFGSDYTFRFAWLRHPVKQNIPSA